VERRALDDFVERARGVRRRAELDATAVEVLDAFEDAGVDSLLLKGPALARLLYRADEQRGYGDLDLLVAPNDLTAARDALARLGFNESSARMVFGVDDVGGVVDSEIWVRGGYTGPILIDLHWRLPGSAAPEQIAWEGLARRRTTIEVEGRNAPVLDREGLALHLGTHAAQHGHDDVKALGDLERGIERWPAEVWQAASRLAAEIEATPAFAAGLRLLPAGADLADQLALPDTPELSWQIRHRKSRPRGTYHLRALAEARGVRARLNVLRRSLFPTRRWIVVQFPWASEGRFRLIAAYTAHLARTPLWAARAWRFRRRAKSAAD
jgi:hypothetical protein